MGWRQVHVVDTNWHWAMDLDDDDDGGGGGGGVFDYTLCPEKWDQNVSVILPIKLRWFWWQSTVKRRCNAQKFQDNYATQRNNNKLLLNVDEDMLLDQRWNDYRWRTAKRAVNL